MGTGRITGLAAALVALACIDVAQIRGPISDKSGASDAGTDVHAPVDVAPGSVALGGACDGNEDCAEGSCVDYVCCRQGACPLCEVCGTGGDCVRVGAGIVEPHFRCHPPDSPESCGRSGACDGMGACAFYPTNVECRKGVCEGDAVVGSQVCNGRGQCLPAPTRICVPFRCSGEACLEKCESSADCAGGVACVDASCGKRSKGAACQSDSDCVSGFCADGVCCNVACQGPCVSCNLADRSGTCWPVNANEADPHRVCADTGPASCGSTGACDGLGGCLGYTETTVCRRSCAADGSTLTTSFCDGLGACGPAATVATCPTNVCDASTPDCR